MYIICVELSPRQQTIIVNKLITYKITHNIDHFLLNSRGRGKHNFKHLMIFF